MAFQRSQALLRIHIPNLNSRVETSNGQPVAFRATENGRQSRGSERREREWRYLPPIRGVINGDLRLIRIADGKPAATRIELHRVDAASRLPALLLHAGLEIEAANGVPIRKRDQPAVGTERRWPGTFRLAL